MKEQLSALIDGEFDIDNAEHLLLVAKSDGELKQSWVSYHLIGDVMRGDHLHFDQMTNRIMDRLDDEPTVIAPSAAQLNQNQAKEPFLKRPVIWSVAASVAAVFFVGLMLLQNQKVDQDNMQPIEIAESVPTEYLTAHQTFAPNGASYYIQNATYAGQ
jgi:sigma-E factor negative regulatory protein RseA